MSIRVMTWVWEHSSAEGIELLVLLAIADHASDDGSDAYPSVHRLSQKTRVSERTVQRAIRSLTLAGEITTDFGAGRGGSNVYAVTMAARQVVTPSAATSDNATPVSLTPRHSDGVSGVTPGGENCVTRTVLEPSFTPQPPASGGVGAPDHCAKHSRYRRSCENCAKALAASKAKPSWCGACHEGTRQIEDDVGKVRRCPECHPLRKATA